MSYRLTDRAEADLAAIWDDSAERWTVEQADRYLDALMSRFLWITENSALWTPRPDLAEGLYSYPQQSHVIYFRTRADDPDLIEIVRVLHGRMEPDKHI